MELDEAASIVKAELLALKQNGGQCSGVERHIEPISRKFLHLEATIWRSETRVPVDTIILHDCPEPMHWLLLARHLQYVRAQFATKPLT